MGHLGVPQKAILMSKSHALRRKKSVLGGGKVPGHKMDQWSKNLGNIEKLKAKKKKIKNLQRRGTNPSLKKKNTRRWKFLQKLGGVSGGRTIQ